MHAFARRIAIIQRKITFRLWYFLLFTAISLLNSYHLHCYLLPLTTFLQNSFLLSRTSSFFRPCSRDYFFSSGCFGHWQWNKNGCKHLKLRPIKDKLNWNMQQEEMVLKIHSLYPVLNLKYSYQSKINNFLQPLE